MDNVVEATLSSLEAPRGSAARCSTSGAVGHTPSSISWRPSKESPGGPLAPRYAPARTGDVRHSCADVARARARSGTNRACRSMKGSAGRTKHLRRGTAERGGVTPDPDHTPASDQRDRPKAGREGTFGENAAFSVLAWVVPAVAVFFCTPITVRGLGPDAYGLLALVSALTGYLGLIDLGLSQALLRYLSYYRALDEGRPMIAIIRASLVWFTTAGAAAGLSSHRRRRLAGPRRTRRVRRPPPERGGRHAPLGGQSRAWSHDERRHDIADELPPIRHRCRHDRGVRYHRDGRSRGHRRAWLRYRGHHRVLHGLERRCPPAVLVLRATADAHRATRRGPAVA